MGLVTLLLPLSLELILSPERQFSQHRRTAPRVGGMHITIDNLKSYRLHIYPQLFVLTLRSSFRHLRLSSHFFGTTNGLQGVIKRSVVQVPPRVVHSDIYVCRPVLSCSLPPPSLVSNVKSPLNEIEIVLVSHQLPECQTSNVHSKPAGQER